MEGSVTIQSLWQTYHNKRGSVLTRAEDSAKLTIPSVFPPSSFSEDTDLEEPYQSLGSRAVSNLTAKFTQTLFPPNATFFRLVPSKEVEERINVSVSASNVLDELNKGLVKIESAISNALERQSVRSSIHEAITLLIVTGNALMWKSPNGLQVFNLRNYVVKRDNEGTVIDLIVKEMVSINALPPGVKLKETSKEEVVIYTRMHRNMDGDYEIYQEVDDSEVPGSRGMYPKGKPTPFIVLRWTALAGENYGRGLVERYIGDLRTYEALNMSIVDIHSTMSKTVFMVNPNTQFGTDIDDLKEAVTGDYIPGHADDITVPQVGKWNDLRSLITYMDAVEARLSQAFLLNVFRDAERVTAEEIRQRVQALEETLGGVYTILAEELQKPLLEIYMDELNIKLDKEIEVVITTGVDALGRGNDAIKLQQYLGFIQQVEGGMQYINVRTLIERGAYSLGIKQDNLIKSEEELQAQMQAQQNSQAQQGFMESLATNGAKSLTQGNK